MRRAAVVVTILLAGVLHAQIGYQDDPNADSKKTLLLKDFNPVSMLHTEEHQVLRTNCRTMKLRLSCSPTSWIATIFGPSPS